MADESGKLSTDYGDNIKDNNSYENGLGVDDVDFSDPEEFVDDVTDDGLWRVLIVRHRTWCRTGRLHFLTFAVH